MFLFATDPPDPIRVPLVRQAVWVERLLWVFAMSFALDYRSADSRESTGGAGLDQLLFLALCMGSTAWIVFLGWRQLVVRPMVWLLGFWALFLLYMVANSLLQGVQVGRSMRIIMPLFFCLFGMVNVHIAGCMGIRPSRIVSAVFAMACINVIWRIVQGFVFKGASLETVRLEVLSPVNDWLAAWIACAIILRGKFSRKLLLACTILFIGVFITITRSLIFPLVASGMAATFCYMLGIRWRQYEWSGLWKRLLPGVAVGVFFLGAVALIAVVQPMMIERWTDRLFHSADARNLSADISYLTRRAEADAMKKILLEEPAHFINGRGIGASYYWDPAYLSEIQKVIPIDEGGCDNIWMAGHSLWTYSIFSGGLIALFCYLGILISTMLNSLLCARANSSDPGPDHWLAFLPFVATCALLSVSVTANPFQERLVGIIFGMMTALPQAFMVRASWIHASGRSGS